MLFSHSKLAEDVDFCNSASTYVAQFIMRLEPLFIFAELVAPRVYGMGAVTYLLSYQRQGEIF